MSRRVRLSSSSTLLAGLVAVAAFAGPPPEDQQLFPPSPSSASGGVDAAMELPVKVRFLGPQDPVAPGGEATVEIQFQVAEHAYVNQELTRVQVAAAEGLVAGEPQFPEPQIKDVPSLGKIAKIFKGNFTIRVPVRVQPDVDAPDVALGLNVRYQACNDRVCFIPRTEKTTLLIKIGGAPSAAARPIAPAPAADPIAPPALPKSDFARQLERGLLFAYLFAFFGGILASLTPCVYPMIPITIAVIGARKAKSRSQSFLLSLVFVLGIATIYSILGVTAAATGSVFGGLLQNRLVVGLVALVFALLGLGMLGFYDMTVPAPLAARLNRMGGQGYAGAYVVGMVTGIVASPCVGPVLVGMLGWVATTQSLVLGFTLLFVFALGLGMLFLVIGTFTGVLMSLPRSGGWMIRVKHGLGVLLFAVAWYFALPILPLWLPLALLVPGLLVLASGELESHRERKFAAAWMAAAATYLGLVAIGATWPGTVATGWTPTQAIHGGTDSDVKWLRTEADGLAQAAREHKPLMIDFYADWCLACKELDLYTYTDPDVTRALDGFVSVKLDGTDSEDPHFAEPYKKIPVCSGCRRSCS